MNDSMKRSSAPASRARLSKLAPPRVQQAYPVRRLFRELDAARSRGVAWLSAPAGYGKTTLAVSYLSTRRIKPLWYTLDERDDDPAAFFYYLREAVRKHAPRRRETLPLLTPEYVRGMPVYARNFFDIVFERLRMPAVLVFDDYHSLCDTSVLHELLSKVFASVPTGISIFVLSRHMPPASFVALQANQVMRVLDVHTMSLAFDEVREIARSRQRHELSSKTLETLYSRIQGWAAAWTLLFECSPPGELVADIPNGTRDKLFDYFLAELFKNTPPDVQQLLMKTAVLPQVCVALAEALTGMGHCAAMLAELERRNYLTARLSGSEAVYQFHPLFREFLLTRLQQALSARECRLLQQTAARLLSDRGEHDGAAALLVRSADWDALVLLIVGQASQLAAQGRIATLRSWIDTLPSAKREDPWLEYWFAVCRLPYDPAEARLGFERSYDVFKSRENGRGQYCALAGAVHPVMMQSGNYRGTERWLDELTTLERRWPLGRYPDLEPQVAYSVLAFLSMVGTDAVQISRWCARMERLSRRGRNDEPLELMILIGLNVHYYWSGKVGQARRARERLLRYLAAARPDGFLKLQGYMALTYSGVWTGDLEVGVEWAQAGLRLGAEIGVRALESSLLAHTYYIAEQARDMPGAESALLKVDQSLIADNRVDQAHYDFMAANLAWQQGDLTAARERVERAVLACEAMHLRLVIAQTHLIYAQILVELGEFERATSLEASARQYAQLVRNPSLLALSDQTVAWIALRQGDEDGCAAALSRSFGFARRNRCVVYMSWNARVAGPLCEFALAHNIETDHARSLIRRWHLAPSSSASHQTTWPWRVRVRTLGRFEVLIDDEPIIFGRKAQRKPLELLQALIALGGRDVREDRIADVLWPEAEADRARDSVNVTQHRLRKLIGEGAILRRNRRLSLDAQQCWVDLWVLEDERGVLDRACRERDLSGLERCIDRVFDLYRGPFLLGSNDHPCVLGTRETLHARFLRELETVAEAFCSGARYEIARRCLEKGLEIDPLAERLYRELMRVHLAEGHVASALDTYSRCRRMLKISLGVLPSSDTEALARQVVPTSP